MIAKNKYIFSLVVEGILLALYIFFPKAALILVGARKQQVNLLGVILLTSLHFEAEARRKRLIETELEGYRRLNTFIEIGRILLVILAAYRLQVCLDAGI